MEKKYLARVEAFIFAAEDPIPLKDISKALDINKRECRKYIKKLNDIICNNQYFLDL